MYYIDGTRYDQVDGTGPVVPSVKEDGTRYSCSRLGLYQDTWQYLGWDQEYQVDGTDPVLPGVLVNGTTGPVPSTWSYLVPSM